MSENQKNLPSADVPAVEKNTRLDNFHSKIIPEILQRFYVIQQPRHHFSILIYMYCWSQISNITFEVE